MPITAEPSTFENLRNVRPEKLKEYVGFPMTAFVGMSGFAGLLIAVEDGKALIYQPRLDDKPRAFDIARTGFQRRRGTTPRPALARAVAYHLKWKETEAALRGANGEIIDQADYDERRDDHEHGLIGIFANLMGELAASPVCETHPVNHGDTL
ncbi:hypothetical protein [Streptomyces sp. NPDC086776]|uniref:hypothetical protein n=1 Tax=Streptomyces sp. NPDC086776 TaxID=3365756 RepID=UPI0037F4C7DA